MQVGRLVLTSLQAATSLIIHTQMYTVCLTDHWSLGALELLYGSFSVSFYPFLHAPTIPAPFRHE